VVGAVGALVARQLREVPENLIKWAVGIMLTSLGAFWMGEGAGIAWPGGDLAIPVLVAVFLAASLLMTAVLKTRALAPPVPAESS